LLKKRGFRERRGIRFGVVLRVMLQIPLIGIVAGQLAHTAPEGFELP
jgi:hypothetical protein